MRPGRINLLLNFEDVPEFGCRPGQYTRPYRVVVLRKNISKLKGEKRRFDETRYLHLINF